MIAALAAPDDTAARDILVETRCRWTDVVAMDTDNRAFGCLYTDAVFVFDLPEHIEAL